MAQLLLWSAICWAAGAAPPDAVTTDGVKADSAKSDPAKPAHAPRGADSAHRGEWEIVFEDGITIKQYAEQIDYFKIEIGAVSKDGKAEYISKVAARKPDKRLGDAASDYRWRIGWRKGTLQAADRRLLAKAGINDKDKQLLHFFPAEIQSRLATLERSYAHRDPAEIKRTRFEIRPKAKDAGYEFVVIEQDPPKPTRSNESSAPPYKSSEEQRQTPPRSPLE
jgi:hypothetical protein